MFTFATDSDERPMCVIECLSRAARAMADADTVFVMLWLMTLCPTKDFLLRERLH